MIILVMLAYIVSPINQMYSITMWKDIPFAAFVLLFIVLLSYMCERHIALPFLAALTTIPDEEGGE